MPASSLPVPQEEDTMPLGMQLVGARERDGRLLEAANWLERLCY
jgi:Asp-tRNA(Asn)/Glu-tRNA(Gln) amidotransferase A subunit family amidase